MADLTLSALRNKVRRLSRVPTAAQISDADINNYIDLAYRYQFPAELKLSSLRRTFTFYTQPNVDTYATNTTDIDNPMYNFKNAVLQSSDPVYVGGYPAQFSQSRSEFFAQWPLTQFQQNIATGDGATTTFSGTLNQIPVIPNNVQFTSIDSDGEATGVTDVPVIDPATGIQTQNGNLYSTLGPIPSTNQSIVTALSTINYKTGVYTFEFGAPPASGEAVYAYYIPYAAARPITVLWFNNSFTVRPVPDKSYPITIECQVRPTQLIDNGNIPEIEEWFEYIAFLAAKKVCEDRNDMETIQILMPSLEEQQKLVERRTLIQQGDKRAATIYSSPVWGNGYNNAWWQRW